MKRALAFVDLDSLYIINNMVNVSVFQARLDAIRALPMTKRWFGNESTRNILSKNGIKLGTGDKPIIVSNKPENVDHAILRRLSKVPPATEVHVISNDVIMHRLGFFLNKNTDIHFWRFKQTKLEDITNRIDICFKKKQDLQKFIDSYKLYIERLQT